MDEPIARHTITHDGQDLTKPGNQDGDRRAPLLPAGEPVEQLLRKAQFFVPGGTPSPDFREVHRTGGRARRSSTANGGGTTRWCGQRTG